MTDTITSLVSEAIAVGRQLREQHAAGAVSAEALSNHLVSMYRLYTAGDVPLVLSQQLKVEIDFFEMIPGVDD